MERQSIALQLKCLNNLFKRYVDAMPLKTEVDRMTGMHGSIIGYIAHHADAPVYQSDIEQAFTMRRSTASRIIQLMEKKGLIYRKADDADSRRKQLYLTPQALDIHKAIDAEIRKTESKLVEKLTPDEIEMLLVMIEKMRASLSENDAPAGAEKQEQKGTDRK